MKCIMIFEITKNKKYVYSYFFNVINTMNLLLVMNGNFHDKTVSRFLNQKYRTSFDIYHGAVYGINPCNKMTT